MEPSLIPVLREAINACYYNVPDDIKLEEHGGMIMQNDGVFRWFPLKNSNTGTPIATHLFVADRIEHATTVLSSMRKGWKNYGTFHTHPQFSVTPSSIDWNYLFKSSPNNFIYSPATDQMSVTSMVNGEWIITFWDVSNNLEFTPSDGPVWSFLT